MFKSRIQLQSGYLKTTSNLSDRLGKSNLYIFYFGMSALFVITDVPLYHNYWLSGLVCRSFQFSHFSVNRIQKNPILTFQEAATFQAWTICFRNCSMIQN